MSLFQSYTFKWWQLGIFKLALLAVGSAAGAHWSAFFSAHLTALMVTAIAASSYVIYVALRGSSVQPPSSGAGG